MTSHAEFITHRLINRERKRKRIPPVRWSQEMYHLAKGHSRKMAREGHLFHTGRPALEGGENVAGGKGKHSPKELVRCWMGSPLHREWLLDYRVGIAAVGISRSRYGTFAAWSFSSGEPDDSPVTGLVAILYFPFWLFREFFKAMKKTKGENKVR